MRNKITHGYLAVDYEKVWNTVKEDLPILRRQIGDILGAKVG